MESNNLELSLGDLSENQTSLSSFSLLGNTATPCLPKIQLES